MKKSQPGPYRNEEERLHFQPDADLLEHKPIPHASRWALYLLAALILVFVLWACIAKIDKIVVTHGKLVTRSPKIVVQPLETSIIREILVKEGQIVNKGQILAKLDPTFTQADLQNLQTKLRSLRTQIDRLRAELRPGNYVPQVNDEHSNLQAQLFAQRMAAYNATMHSFAEKLQKLQAQLAANRNEQRLLGARLGGLKEIEGMRVRLYEKKSGSRLKLLEAKNDRLAVEREWEKTKDDEPRLVHEIRQVRAERNAFTNNHRKEIAEELLASTRESNGLTMELEKAIKRKELILLKSPDAAVVFQVAERSMGSVVKPAETLFTLVPLNSRLEAEVAILAKDVGYVRTNDRARIKFTAFPFQKHGTALGKVLSISEDSLPKEPGVTANNLKELVYMARLSIAELKLRAVPKDFRLIPGMTLTAEIDVGDRTVITYFLYPLLKAFDESIREP